VDNAYGSSIWLWAMANPHPERELKTLRLRGAGGPLIVCGITLFHGDEHPLRYQRLSLYRVTLPEGTAADKDRWQASVDLGIVARIYTLSQFQPEAWLRAPDAGIGAHDKPVQGGRQLFLELTAAANATLSLRDTRNNRIYEFDLARVVPGQEMEATSKEARIEILEVRKVWLHGTLRTPKPGILLPCDLRSDPPKAATFLPTDIAPRSTTAGFRTMAVM
jgi:hypothetical protein